MSKKRDIDVSKEAGLIWKVANDVLRDIFQKTEYPDIIYPMVLIRRLECVLKAQTREIAREKGRKAAMASTKKIDTIFTPNNYNADDAKVMFHPVDFLIFNGMKEKNSIDNLVLFDREVKEAAQKALQKSVEKTVEKENYEWITMQVSEDGSVEYK